MPRDPHKDQPILQGGAALGTATSALILLHGRGGSAQEMLTLARELVPTAASPTAFFVPEAAGRQWYPFSLLEKVEKNQGAMNSALSLVNRIVEKAAAANIPPEKTALFGFSQGATVALEFAARNAHRYNAVIALSGALLGPEGTPREYEGSLDGTPVFFGSGDRDPNIPKRRVDEAATVFERLGAVVTKKFYEGLAHAIDPDEIIRAKAMLGSVTPSR